jgi:glycosyltransferase involved in cell wall biosynthesis
VVSTDCPSGPSEILQEGEYGRLVPVGDAEALAEAVLETLDDPPAAERLEGRAEDFLREKIAGEYLNLLL